MTENEKQEKREKVIKGLECCLPMTIRNGFGDCGECPYDRKITLEGGVTECCHELMLDALALLKEQERLLHIAKAMHTWIFLHTADEYAVYDELGLTGEDNAMLGSIGKVVVFNQKKEQLTNERK